MASAELINEEFKIPLPKCCVLDVHPQRQAFVFDELSLDSNFDSANLTQATKVKDFHVKSLPKIPFDFLVCYFTRKRCIFNRKSNYKQNLVLLSRNKRSKGRNLHIHNHSNEQTGFIASFP